MFNIFTCSMCFVLDNLALFCQCLLENHLEWVSLDGSGHSCPEHASMVFWTESGSPTGDSPLAPLIWPLPNLGGAGGGEKLDDLKNSSFKNFNFFFQIKKDLKIIIWKFQIISRGNRTNKSLGHHSSISYCLQAVPIDFKSCFCSPRFFSKPV